MSGEIAKYSASRRIGGILYTIGTIICILLWPVLIWGDLEASLFGTYLPADKNLSTLRCPVVIARNEVGYFRVEFKNHTDRKLSTNVKSYISQGYMSLIEESNTLLRLEPGEGKTLEWRADSKSAVWNRLIMVRIYSSRQYPYPSYTGTCGILVIGELPISGDILFWGILIFGVTGLIAGMYLIGKEITKFSKPGPGILAALILLGIIVLLGLSFGLLGNWLVSLLMLILALILLVVALGNKILET